MNYNEMCNILNNPKSSKEQLRSALASALGVEYKAATKEQNESVFNACKSLFCELYSKEIGLTYSFTAQDGKALKELIGKVQSIISYPATEGEVINIFCLILNRLPDWYRKNAFSLPVINKKFNDIVSSIKQGNERGQSNISSAYKQKLIDDLQS